MGRGGTPQVLLVLCVLLAAATLFTGWLGTGCAPASNHRSPGWYSARLGPGLGISLPELDDSLLPLSLGGPGKSMTTWLEA